MPSPVEIKYFIEVAQVLNLSRASERLGISQPSLSVAIKRLEEEIGTALLFRHRKGVNLTQAGKQLLAHARQLLQYWDAIKMQALASHHEVQGSFILGCHPSIGLSCLSGFLPELLLKHPKLEIQLFHDISRKINERIINLSLDLGIVVNPVRHPDLIIYKLADDIVTFWESTENSHMHANSVVICDTELIQTQTLLKKFQKNTQQPFRLLASSNLEVIASLTETGSGIGILPGSVASLKKLKKMENMPSFQDEICLVYRYENKNIKAMQILMESIKGYFLKRF